MSTNSNCVRRLLSDASTELMEIQARADPVHKSNSHVWQFTSSPVERCYTRVDEMPFISVFTMSALPRPKLQAIVLLMVAKIFHVVAGSREYDIVMLSTVVSMLAILG